MTKKTMATGEVLTGSSETNRFIRSNAIRSVDLDSLSIIDSLSLHAAVPPRDDGGSLIPWKICAVSSVVEHYLDTVGVTGSNPVSRTIITLRSLPSVWQSVAATRRPAYKIAKLSGRNKNSG